MDKNYVVYHLHSDLSNGVTNIDSVTKYSDYIKKASSLGMKALAFSEHGSVFSWVKKKESIEKAGLKYIHAEEFYVTSNREEKIRDNKHVVLIAKNWEGVKELNILSSKAFNREDGSFYYAPRITIDDLLSTTDNIIVTTACLGGIIADQKSPMYEQFLMFLVNNKHRCFLEIQHHNVKDQIEYNKRLLAIHNSLGIPLIAGTDTHALNAEHVEGRKILQKAKDIYFENEEGWDLTFKSYDELVEAYKNQNSIPIEIVLEAINNTNVMADMIEEFSLDRSYKYPHLWENPEETFNNKIKEGIIRRGVDKYPNYQEYLDRIEYELQAYKHNGAIDFMLLMEDIISWCRDNDIVTGYGRGSVNGSVIAWVIGITEMDAIKHKLNFERFMNIERVSLSDIDTDFPPSRIDEVKNYIFNHHGLNCCDIITFNTIADKGAIRDVGRALQIPLGEVAKICDSVDNETEYAKSKKNYPELFKYVDIVNGVIVSIGNHPCGMVVSPITLDDNMGTCTTSTDPLIISQIYMKEIDGLNYVKLDLLKLDTIEVIYNTCKLAGIPLITPDNMDINDVNVWNSMRDDTTGIFQWESNTALDYIRRLLSDDNINKFKAINENVDRMTLLSIGNSAIRPAGASYRDDLANGIIRKSGSDAIDEFLKPTFGYLVFQCQIIEFLHSYCGFTMGEADIVRRHFAKKTGTDKDIPIIQNGGYMDDSKKHYIPGFCSTMNEMYGMSKEEADNTIAAFLQVIIDASDYLFSLNHSQPYSYEGYACAWLRYYYPLEFITCSLNKHADKEDKTIAFTNYARSVGISILPIKFGHSKSVYSPDKNTNGIYKGISSIKFFNDTVAEELYDLSQKTYTTFLTILIDIKKYTSVNSRQLDILVKLGFFDQICEINKSLKIIELFNALWGKKQIKKDKLFTLGIPESVVAKYAKSETEKQFVFDERQMYLFLNEYCDELKVTKASVRDVIKWQQEFLGYIDYVDPNANSRLVFVTKLDTTYSPKFIGYSVKTGKTCELRVSKKKNPKEKDKTTFSQIPFENGDMLMMIKCEKKPKVHKEGDKWVETPNEFNWWLNSYEKV